MKRLLGTLLPTEVLLLAVVLLSGCSAPAPRDFGGHWNQANRFSTTAEAIPLKRPYEYFASPLDGTLKDMLSRWARDTKTRLDYRFPDDFTLYTPVSTIRTPDVETAVSELNSIYAKQGVSVVVLNGTFVVTAASPVAPAGTGLIPNDTATGPSQPKKATPQRTPSIQAGGSVGSFKRQRM